MANSNKKGDLASARSPNSLFFHSFIFSQTFGVSLFLQMQMALIITHEKLLQPFTNPRPGFDHLLKQKRNIYSS